MPLGAIPQLRLSFLLAIRLVDRAVVFGSVLVAQPLGAVAPGHPIADDDERNNHHDGNDNHDDQSDVAHGLGSTRAPAETNPLRPRERIDALAFARRRARLVASGAFEIGGS